jgi:predicted DNA-binding transcriptional regulator AlpA
MKKPRPAKQATSAAAANTLLNSEDAAQILGCSARTLASWRIAGDGPKFVAVGRLIRYRRGDLEEWLQSRTRTITVGRVA